MASVTSNRSKFTILGTYFLNDPTSTPNGFFMALITAAGVSANPNTPVAPTSANALTWDDVSMNEIPAGNGYVSGGIPLTRNAQSWTTFTEDDLNNRALVGLKPIEWMATGGNLPMSGNGAAYAVLCDDSAQKNILMVLDLGGSRTVSDTQKLILQNVQFIAV